MLARQVALYTMGESTSLPEYDAHRLLASTCFVLGVDADDADVDIMRAALDQGIEVLYARNLAHIEEQARGVGDLWREVCFSVPMLESVALKDTLESLRDFSARYEPRFFAHEIPADIDYPLCCPVPETTLGVAYVTAYLERLLVECRFLRQFDLDRCQTLLRRVHPDYGELILNLFEPIATVAIGCALGGDDCDVRALRMDAAACRRAQEALEGAAGRTRHLVEAAARQVGEVLALDGETRAYLVALGVDLVPRIDLAVRRGSLARVFLAD